MDDGGEIVSVGLQKRHKGIHEGHHAKIRSLMVFIYSFVLVMVSPSRVGIYISSASSST